MEPNTQPTEERHVFESELFDDSDDQFVNPNRVFTPDTPDKTVKTSNGPTPMQIKRFLFGMLVAAGGIALMLIVALGMLQGWVHKDLSLAAIGLCMILGLMMLGGGFGVMATASGTFDDDEFDRLMAGEKREQGDGEHERHSELPHIHQKQDVPTGTANRASVLVAPEQRL